MSPTCLLSPFPRKLHERQHTPTDSYQSYHGQREQPKRARLRSLREVQSPHTKLVGCGGLTMHLLVANPIRLHASHIWLIQRIFKTNRRTCSDEVHAHALSSKSHTKTHKHMHTQDQAMTTTPLSNWTRQTPSAEGRYVFP